MLITSDTPVVGVPPGMAKERFIAILREASSPAADEAADAFDVIVQRRVSAAFALAIFKIESQFGTQGICAKYGTRNPGNTRTPRMMDFPVIQTERGQFVRYPTWVDGFADAAFRLVDPTFVYAQRGLRTIGEIIPVWAPAEDANDPYGYAASVVRLMNTWKEDMTMRDPQATWAPSSNYDAGRAGYSVIGIVDHITQGTDSLAWLRGAAGGSSNRGSSAHYLISRDGALHQMVDDLDTAWGAGNLLFNRQRIQIEHEGFSGQPLTPAQIQASAGLHRRLSQRHGFPLDRQHVIGHGEVPNPNNPALLGGLSGHVGCPGSAFPWDQVLGAVPVDQHATVPPLEAFLAPTGKRIVGGFMDLWISLNPDQQNLRFLGWPLSDEFIAQVDGSPQNYTYQVFERSVLTWRGGLAAPWDRFLVMPDEAAAVRAFAKAHGLLG
ncbi:N-acetylmuramoyl-L-alanine amidase [Nitrolancea hollandica]|uniref:N-acetylmuramoyl-L-alanine amidase n=1 Tax=Nitrolancea hollandica Lb TaxID=1129897 RepID=I4EG45_9BACT|nr:N-acetylmuramoyl-L-alanine amidase [Nitrolancea hollandica]CCF83657.1 putative N-acetylmuramoyl-L-alanine amidase,family 2 [Nitrolancea hollandica Lb]